MLASPRQGRRLRRPAKKHKVTFLSSYFCVTKSTKSHLRGFSILLKISFRVHELVARSSAWRVRAAKGKVKIGDFATLRNFGYTTRANISHERAEQIRARIACTPAYKGAAGIDTYAKHVCRRRRDGASWGKCLR